MTDEQVNRAADEDQDSPSADWEPGQGPQYEARLIRFEPALLAWLDQQPKPNLLMNELLRRHILAQELKQTEGRLSGLNPSTDIRKEAS